MILTDDEVALLDDNADDWYGLWEVEWWFNAIHPEWSRESRTNYLFGLVQRGLIEVFFGLLGRESPPLDERAALAALTDPTSWLPRTAISDTVYHVSTSQAGIEALAHAPQMRAR